MKTRDLLEEWNLNKLSINLGFLNTEWHPQDDDKTAAWKLYIELVTRVSTQYLEPTEGNEKAALESLHKLFDITREITKEHGRRGQDFTRLAILFLNYYIRPFTSKWHQIVALRDELNSDEKTQFRTELRDLQKNLRSFTKLLANLAGVEDLTNVGENLSLETC